MTMLLQMNSALHSGLLSVQVNQTPGLYAGPGVYPGPGFYPKFYGSRKGSKKAQMMGLPDGGKSFKIGLAVLIQYRRVADTQPAT